MLIKFETKSTRVKGLSFHPRRKWILASLHNGVIQLWDYSEKTMIDKFDEHKGPVRGLDFHKHQPLFVSGGDDGKIKVWDYKLRKCLFTLDAHEDYIRSTFFHHENPWILSASDDMSIRIWNWQSRSRIAILTGHGHYVMCAQFHPSAELILSASIDTTLRLWDIRVLQIKNTAQALPSRDEPGPGLPEILARTDYSVESKDAHMSEINWCAFHPTKDICLSAADDNYIKVWRTGPRNGLSELYTLRGHYNNVNCAVFHPRKDLILSASEDRSIRVWDLEKRIPLCTHRKDVDRFWTLAAHPKENLFAAGHDTGLMIFKTERERPAHVVVKDVILYIKGDHIWKLNMNTGERKSFTKLKAKSELGHYYHRIHCYSFDEKHENQVLVSVRSNHSELNVYDLYKVYRDESEPIRGKGSSALFIGKSRYAVIEWPSRVTFKVNGEEKKPKTPIVANDIFEAGTGRLFLRQKKSDTTDATVSLYDIERGQTINSIKIDAKRVIMSDNKEFVACIETNKITICDGQLNILCPITEQRKIKSAVWDDNGVLIYTTPCHVKYALSDGHTTTIRSVEETLYAMAVRDNKLFCIDKNGDIKQIPLDTREFRFKQAVIKNDRAGILASLRQLNVLTEAEITFLVKKGHPGLALTKVEDPQKKFTLALLAFNIDEALKAAVRIDSKPCWTQLAEVAMQVGHVRAAEMALKRLKRPYQLAMLYLVCGQRGKMLEARALAKELNDTSTEFIISLLAKDFLYCAQIIRRCGQPTLAYTCAVNHGLYDLAQEISEELSEEQLMLLPPLESARKNTSWMQETIPDIGDTVKEIENWPLLNDEQENVDAVLNAEPDIESEVEDKGGWDDDDDLGSSSERLVDDEEEKLEDAQGDGWSDDEPLEDVLDDLADDDEKAPAARVEQKKDAFVAPNPGQSLPSSWAQSSDLALHHVLAGSYKSGFRLLQNQVGAVNPKPLEPIFEDLFRQSRAAYQTFALFSTMYAHPISNREFIGDIPLPLGGFSIEDLNKRLALSYNLFSAAKFDDAINSFRNLLHCTLFLRISGSSEAPKKEAKKMISISREYILGLQVWLEKKNITGKEFDDHKRACELAAYFAKLNMSKHRSKVLEKALGAFVARSVPENFRKTHAAASIARRLLDHLSASDPKKATIVGIAEKVKSSPDVQVDQEIQLDYDDQNPYSLCAATFRPIYKGNQLTECPLCDAKYKPDYSGETCKVCLLSQIGKHSSGIKFEATNYDD